MLIHRMEVVLLQDMSPVKESSISTPHHVLLPNTIIYVLRARQKQSASMMGKGRKERLKACHKMLMLNSLLILQQYALNQTFFLDSGMGHKTDPLDFILDPGNSVKRSKDLNKARKLARKVTKNSVMKEFHTGDRGCGKF